MGLRFHGALAGITLVAGFTFAQDSSPKQATGKTHVAEVRFNELFEFRK